MSNHVLSTDTQAILLLCASFGQNRQTEPQPLTLSEYNLFADWLLENQMRPANLLEATAKEQLQQITNKKLNPDRLLALLKRGAMLSLAVEKWTNQGLWVMGRSDRNYPKRLKQRLRHSAPAILYGVGNLELLSLGGLAIVGSRDIDEDGLSYTQRVTQTSAEQAIQVISGGARGVDQAAMLGVLEAGGTSVGVLADSLTKAGVNSKYRSSIKEGRLTLVSSYDPDAGFNTGNAMGRNKYIYALADYALVVNSTVNQGGTWAGAVEALAKIKDIPVFVRSRMLLALPEASDSEGVSHPHVSDGNLELQRKGAKPFPSEPWNSSLKDVLVMSASNPELVSPEPVLEIAPQPVQLCSKHSKDIYEVVLPVILNHLQRPIDIKSLAESLNVRQSQMQDWLNLAVMEGKVRKTNKPVAYVVSQEVTQLSLL
ncbi:DNA-processing protein DprA [Brunnivagina elsteri]|uniref:SMF family protein n=1 Tax=Brunnivagina elsteri CCALA 953 TaxID=987040 RepID=A0A2A2TEN2_9CYAN|nr:DNA-processing protein DprA [Calothrix elsteri]PAX52257.1 SMF family protein [Calothrix elsteri CCALA 953]